MVFHYFVAFNPGVTRARTRVNPRHSKYNAAAVFKITFNKLYTTYYTTIIEKDIHIVCTQLMII